MKIEHGAMSVPFMLSKITVLSTILTLTVAIYPVPWSDKPEQCERGAVLKSSFHVGRALGKLSSLPAGAHCFFTDMSIKALLGWGPSCICDASSVSALGDPPPKSRFFGAAAAGSRRAPITQWYRVFFFLKNHFKTANSLAPFTW